MLNGSAVLEDINADGLPDIVYGDTYDGYRYYENKTGAAWAKAYTPIDRAPDFPLSNRDTLFVDVNGDGFRDVVRPSGDPNGVLYYAGGNIEDGKFLGFEMPVPIDAKRTDGVNWGRDIVKLNDLNYDGRVDLLVQSGGYDEGGYLFKQILNMESNELREIMLPSVNRDINFEDKRFSLTDFNGDGILDIVRKDIQKDPSDSSVRVWFGLGWGKYTHHYWMENVPSGYDRDFYLQDVNKDGQADLVRINGTLVTYYLNDGAMGFTNRKVVDNLWLAGHVRSGQNHVCRYERQRHHGHCVAEQRGGR